MRIESILIVFLCLTGQLMAPCLASDCRQFGYEEADEFSFVSGLEQRTMGTTFPADSLEMRLARIEFRLFGKTAPHWSDGERLNRLSRVAGGQPDISNLEAGRQQATETGMDSGGQSGDFRLNRESALNETVASTDSSVRANERTVNLSSADSGPGLGSKIKKHGLTALKFAAIAGMLAGQMYLSGGGISGSGLSLPGPGGPVLGRTFTGFGTGGSTSLGIGGLSGGACSLP